MVLGNIVKRPSNSSSSLSTSGEAQLSSHSVTINLNGKASQVNVTDQRSVETVPAGLGRSGACIPVALNVQSLVGQCLVAEETNAA